MSGGTKVHDFRERLKFSHDPQYEPFWQAVYKKAFPDMAFAELATEQSQGQRLGIDRVIHLNTGKTVYVDEKLREQTYPDILLEYMSNDQTGAPGWIEKDLLIDYIAYAFLPSRTCYLLNWPMLRRAWLHYKGKWKQQYEKVPAVNKGYTTWSVAVPIPVLLWEVQNAGIITTSAEAIRVDEPQLNLDLQAQKSRE